MKQRAPTACHSQKKDIGISNHPWVVYVYIYMLSPPPKQKTKKTKKKKNITMGIAGSPMGWVSLVFLVLFFLFFWFFVVCFFVFWFFLLFFFGFLPGALPKESPNIFLLVQ